MVEQSFEDEETGVVEGPGAVKEGLDAEEQQEEAKGEPAGVETDTAGGEGGTGSESEEATGAGVEGGAEPELGEAAVAVSPVGSNDTPVEPTDILERLEKQVEEIIIKAGEEVLEQTTGEAEVEAEAEAEEEERTEETERGEATGEQLNAMEDQIGGETERGGAAEPGGVDDVGQPGDVLVKEESSQVKGSVVFQLSPGGDGEIGSTQAVLRQPTGEQEQEVMTENETDKEEEEVEEEPGSLDANSGLAGGVTAEEAGDVEVAEGAGGDGEGGLGEDVGMPLSGGETVTQNNKSAAVEVTKESSQAGQTEEQEVLVISPGETEHGAGDRTSTDQERDSLPSSTPIGGETGSDNADAEELLPDGANHTEIPSTDDLLTHDPAVATPAEEDLIDQALAMPPETAEAEPGEANGLVEDAAGPSELGLLGVEAWKIGGITAAVMVVLETLVIVIYILKCRTGAKSVPAPAACEEGRVEPEATTGGDCSDDSLPASNGDTQLRIAELDPSDVASALAQHKVKPREEQQELAMSDLPPGPAELLPTPGSAQGSSQDLRTSVL
ncbi:hypothetical protein N1851_001432 [Merluccius polli]|uniref:Uncharacterized protein n=1 Tax=Merluccius polli TaxID=89951 RepID=A0AA47ND49_MERPO|nr:hypothetical protein N1851_001432 [Merluccius polli]